MDREIISNSKDAYDQLVKKFEVSAKYCQKPETMNIWVTKSTILIGKSILYCLETSMYSSGVLQGVCTYRIW